MAVMGKSGRCLTEGSCRPRHQRRDDFGEKAISAALLFGSFILGTQNK
jgi:hypothetical protein